MSRAAFLATAAFRLLPGKMRQRLKQAAGAAGHAPGWAQDMRARKLAAQVKRLDVATGHLAELVAMSGLKSLEGARCMEFGAGHLLAEAFAYHVAGARLVVSTDYFPIVQERHLGLVLADAEDARIIEALAPFGDSGALRARLTGLRARKDFSLGSLAALGLAYVAPYDATKGPLDAEAFDIITSRSVLEHVPRAGAGAILQSLYDSLAPGGAMVHSIHLEDHRDIAGAPYAFLAAGTDWSLAEEDERGNRMRASDWLALARTIKGAEVAMETVRGDPSALPAALAPDFAGRDPEDLATRGATLVLRKPSAPI